MNNQPIHGSLVRPAGWALLCLAVPLVLAGVAEADEWVGASVVAIESPGGRFRAVIAPNKAVFTEDSNLIVGYRLAGAILADRLTGASWRVTLVNSWAPVDVYLLDDGSLLTFDEWGTMGYENTVVYYRASGALAWVRSLDEILPTEVLDRVPRDLSGRQWRAVGELEILISSDDQGRALATVTLWNEDRLTLRLTDGGSWVVEADAGDEAE